VKFFLTNEVEFEFSKEDAVSGDKPDGNFVPDIAELADGLKSCFQVIRKHYSGKRGCSEGFHNLVRLDIVSLRYGHDTRCCASLRNTGGQA
jgi:hypothetical protein